VRADELNIGDVIQTCLLPECQKSNPELLPDKDIGWLVGTFIADGCWGKDGDLVQIASHSDEAIRFDRLREIAARYDGSFKVHFSEGHSAVCHLYGPILTGIIRAYVSGDGAARKHLSPRCWRRCNSFLRAVIDGYLEGDGHWDSSVNRWRIGFTSNDALADDLRTICAKLGWQIRLKRYDHVSQWGVFPGWRGEIRPEVSNHFNVKSDGQIVAIRESRARKFWDIGVADDAHLFALASGVLTHNSKPNPMPESIQDRPTKAHEYIFLLAKSERYFYDSVAIAEPSVTLWTVDLERRRQRLEATGGAISGGLPEKISAGNTRNKRSVWTVATLNFPESHFAVFPPTLIEPCILAGCPPKVCARCAAPWGRVVEATAPDGRKAIIEPGRTRTLVDGQPLIGDNMIDPGVRGSFSPSKGVLSRNTIGWRPSCSCGADVIGGTVLDPFGGAGTTGLVADRLGRNAVLIELNPKYAEMSARRIENDAPLFAEVKYGSPNRDVSGSAI